MSNNAQPLCSGFFNRRMPARVFALLLGASLAALSAGCTYRAWYEGLKEREREECYRSTNQADVQKCLDRVNGKSYDDYEKERAGTKQ